MTTGNQRLIAVDSMRGFTIAAMLVVNFPGDDRHVFATLRHSEWNGLTFTDLVAPFFLFIVGVSIVLAFTPRLLRGAPAKSFHQKIISRAIKIFAVGMFLNLLPHFDFFDLRWTGTLHRIAIVYLVCAFLFLYTGWKAQAWLAAVILVAYWLVMTLIPTPGYDVAMLEPGINLAAWVDSKYLPGKMWQGTWDPEGILSTFPSIVTGITGLLAGRLLTSTRAPLEKAAFLMTTGVYTASLGYFWGLAFPVNENLWTSSFVLVTSGFAALVLGSLYFLMDLKGLKRYAGAGIVFGSNAITVYILGDVLSILCYQLKFGGASLNLHVTQWLSQAGIPPKLSSLLYALLFVGLCYLPILWMYRRRIFVKL